MAVLTAGAGSACTSIVVGQRHRAASRRRRPAAAGRGPTPRTFATTVWGRTLPADPRREALGRSFADLLDADAVDELVSRRGLRTPFLRVAQDGTHPRRPGLHRRRRGRGRRGRPGQRRRAGAAVRRRAPPWCCRACTALWPPLIDFSQELAAELGHPVQVNAYVTPPQSRGFSDHYDVHDVFVLQIEGEKRWRIHAPVHPAPLRTQPWTGRRADVEAGGADRAGARGGPAPGDCLYLARCRNGANRCCWSARTVAMTPAARCAAARWRHAWPSAGRRHVGVLARGRGPVRRQPAGPARRCLLRQPRPRQRGRGGAGAPRGPGQRGPPARHQHQPPVGQAAVAAVLRRFGPAGLSQVVVRRVQQLGGESWSVILAGSGPLPTSRRGDGRAQPHGPGAAHLPGRPAPPRPTATTSPTCARRERRDAGARRSAQSRYAPCQPPPP